MSDSEYEDEDGEVILPQQIKAKGALVNNKSSIVLHELGPRMTLQLIKIEEGLLNGEVLYHDLIVKTDEEIEQLRKSIEKKKRLKAERKKIQEENKEKKVKVRKNIIFMKFSITKFQFYFIFQAKEEQKLKSRHPNSNKNNSSEEIPNEDIDDIPEDDANYYRDEVGEEPDEELFSKNITNSRPYVPKQMMKNKKHKFDQKKSKDVKKLGNRKNNFKHKNESNKKSFKKKNFKK